MRSSAVLALALVLAPALPLAAEEPSPAVPDWGAVSEVRTVEVLTRDADSEPRETTVWLVVVDGSGYVRTGGTRWGDNVVRDPNVVLRIGASEYPLRAEFVEDEALRERITDAFRAKYGFSDRMIGLFRGGRPRIMRLLPRDD